MINSLHSAMSSSERLSSPDEPSDTTKNQTNPFAIRRKIVKEGSVETLLLSRAGMLEVRQLWIPDSITRLSETNCKNVKHLSSYPLNQIQD
jgi:hypothetical protein